MKGKSSSILMAVVMGVILPGILFSIAEKNYPIRVQEDLTSTTLEAITENTSDILQADFVWVLQSTGMIEKMEMDTYLTGVLLGELPADFEEETLKAQAVVRLTVIQLIMLKKAANWKQ